MNTSLSTLLPRLDKIGVTRVRVTVLALIATPIAGLALVAYFEPAKLVRPTSPAEFWTLIAGVGAVGTVSITVGVASIAWYGLRSLRLARQDMETRAIRESRMLAITRGEEFSAMLRGPHPEIQAELAAAKIPSFTQQIRRDSPVFENAALNRPAAEWWAAVPQTTQNKIIFFLNDLEAWAMYFTQALAEANLLAQPCGPTYCAIVMQYAAWIITVRSEQYSGYYPNVLRLFHAWLAELDAQEKGKSIEAAIRAAQAAEERLTQHRVPAPLGTRVDM